MPNVRLVNWNIEKLGPTKVARAGGEVVTDAGRVIAGMQADVVFVLEVAGGSAIASMTALSNAANAASVAAGGNANDYTGWLTSYLTGGECYGVLIRDLNVVRPIQVTGGPSGAGTPARGHEDDPADPNQFLMNLDRNTFATWPAPFPGPWAPLPLPAARPRLPLIDVFATNPPTGRKRARFAGRRLGAGGYALGNGFRMPCLCLLEVVNGGGGPSHLIAVMVCHLGAVRGGANPLARGQVEQYKDTHIAQKFAKFQDAGYIDLNGAAEPIMEIAVTGDFNVDFLQNAAAGNALQTGNRAALNRLTPTVAAGGSAGPAGAPGVAGPVPMVPFAGPFGDGPIHNTIPNLALKTGATANGTILKLPAMVMPGPFPPYVDACFDNFFFGGTQLSATYQVLGGGADACLIVDVPAQVVGGAPAAVGVNLSGTWTYHINRPIGLAGPIPLKILWAILAPQLNPAIPPPVVLNPIDRLVGARYVSDHLPVVLQANLP